MGIIKKESLGFWTTQWLEIYVEKSHYLVFFLKSLLTIFQSFTSVKRDFL